MHNNVIEMTLTRTKTFEFTTRTRPLSESQNVNFRTAILGYQLAARKLITNRRLQLNLYEILLLLRRASRLFVLHSWCHSLSNTPSAENNTKILSNAAHRPLVRVPYKMIYRLVCLFIYVFLARVFHSLPLRLWLIRDIFTQR